jgi:hypothetical protein
LAAHGPVGIAGPGPGGVIIAPGVIAPVPPVPVAGPGLLAGVVLLAPPLLPSPSTAPEQAIKPNNAVTENNREKDFIRLGLSGSAMCVPIQG